MRRIEGLTLNIAAMAMMFLLLFMASEIVVRTLGIFPSPRWAHHPILGTIMISNSTSVVKGPGFTTTFKVNSAGFRDYDYPLEKSPDTVRIAFIGDSVVEGAAVDIADRFDKLLEKKFSEDDLKVEVLNFGLGGHGTDQEYLTYTAIVRDFTPDIVVLVFAFNDPMNNVRELEQNPNKPYYVFRGGSLVYETAEFNYEPHLRQVVEKSFILTELANTIINRARNDKIRESARVGLLPGIEVFMEPLPPEYERAMLVTRALLGLFSGAVAGDKRTFILTHVPQRNLIHPKFDQALHLEHPAIQELNYTNEEQFLVETSRDYNLTLIRTSDYFQSTCAIPCFVDFAHLNKEGNRVFSESLYPTLKDYVIQAFGLKQEEAAG